MTSLALSDDDVRGLLDAIEVMRAWGPQGVPRELLQSLSDLVPCDVLTAAGQDSSCWHFFLNQDVPELATSVTEPPVEIYQEHYWESDCSYPDRTGDLGSITLTSDFYSVRQYHSTPMYTDYLKFYGVENELMVCLPAGGPQRTLRLLFARGVGPDFSERDRALLVLLRPHLLAAWAQAQRGVRPVDALTGRQREILQLVGAGDSNRMIARRTNLSEATVRKHLENIYARLGVSSRTAALSRVGATVPEWETPAPARVG